MCMTQVCTSLNTPVQYCKATYTFITHVPSVYLVLGRQHAVDT